MPFGIVAHALMLLQLYVAISINVVGSKLKA